MRPLSNGLASCLTFCLACSPLLPVRAQNAAPSVKLPEVIVSAERRETTLLKTPVSVATLSQEDIERKGIAQLSDLVGVIAGVSVPNGYSNMPQAVGIRGVGVSNPAMSQAVGIYVDDVPLVRGYATALWDLPDIVRIEVLRGPQGTLYGQNTSAGAIKLISRDPGTDDSRWLSVSGGNHGAMELRGYGNFKLSDAGSAASIAFSRRVNDGFGRNEALGKSVNELDATQFRMKFKSSLNESLSAVLAIDGLLDRSDANTTNFPLNHPSSKPRVTYTSDPNLGAFKRRAGGAQLKLEQKLQESLVLRSITAYREYRDDPTLPDWGGLEQRRFSLDQAVSQEAVSQELQLQGRSEAMGLPFAWTSGLMLLHDRFNFHRYTTSVPLATNIAQFTEAKTRLSTLDAGIYGQGRLYLHNDVGLTLGLRAYRTRQTGANAFYRTDAMKLRTSTVYEATDLTFSKSGLLPRIGLDWQPSQEHLLYTSVAEGAKFGGFNRAAESLQSALVATQPEKVRNYELGAKSRFAGGRISTQMAGFYNDYRNYLAVLNNTIVNGVLVTDPVMVNAGKAKSYGVDLEATAKLSPELEWSASLEWLRSAFTQFANPSGSTSSNFVGKQLPYAPRLSAGSSLSYIGRMADDATLRIELSAQYIRRQYADVANSAALALPSQTYLNLGASYTPARGPWSFALRVRNLQDKTYVLLRTRVPPLGVDSAYYNAPRTVLLTARYEH